MSAKPIFCDEVEFFCKKDKWKKCLCTIKSISSRVKNIFRASIKELPSRNLLEKIEIYGYESLGDKFTLIGRKDYYFIRFKEVDKMLDLKKKLKKYLNDVSYYLQFEEYSKGDCILKQNEWYKFHVQQNRICLMSDISKSYELIKTWNIFLIGEVTIIDSYLNIEIKSGKDFGIFKFHHDTSSVLEEISDTIKKRKLPLPTVYNDQINLVKRNSECVDLKRYNSYSNSREMTLNHRCRTKSENNTFHFDASMPSTPVPINEYVEPPLIFQMDSIESDSTDSTVIYDGSYRCKTNSEDYDISSECENKRKVELERYPYEAEAKSKTNSSPSSQQKDELTDNVTISSRPNNGKYYLPLSSLKSISINSKTSSNNTSVDSDKLPLSESGIFSSSLKSEGVNIPTDSLNISVDCQSLSSIRSQNSTLYSTSVYKDDNQNNYYNLSKPTVSLPSRNSRSNNYYNFCPSTLYENKVQYNSFDNKIPQENPCSLNYVKLDFSDYSNDRNLKFIPNTDSDSNYKEIDIKNTEALKSLDDFSISKQQKRLTFPLKFNRFFKNN